ncbi:MAG: VWA domain-containing protein [Saprospiraceae bacterium]|nr:VWA domain-containing protein [Saprospiraceae bacterium]
MMVWNDILLAQPWWLVTLAVLPVLLYLWYRSRNRRYLTMRVSSLPVKLRPTIRSLMAQWLPILNFVAAALLIIALARPQKLLQEKEIKAEGIDIFLVMDLSSSMLARDFRPDRLEASKRLGAEFIDKRPHDRIGLAVFAGEAFTQCPLTSDHKVVKEFLAGLKCGFLEDGTAIGMGLAAGVNRLKDSKAKSKVIILLTDGVNNAGYIQPMTAAEIAREFKVKVYTIGVGSEGTALSPVRKRNNGEYIFGMARVEIDEALLRKISDMTGGQYFRARNVTSLQRIYEQIDQLERTEMDVTVIKRYEERFHAFALIAIGLLVLSWLLRRTLLKDIP